MLAHDGPPAGANTVYDCCLIAEQVSYYLPGYLPPEQIFVPSLRASDSIIMGAYAEQGLAFEGELERRSLCAGQWAVHKYMRCLMWLFCQITYLSFLQRHLYPLMRPQTTKLHLCDA